MIEKSTDGPTILVRAEETRDVATEFATLAVTVRVREKTRADAVRRLAERSEVVRAVLDEHGLEIENRATGAVVIRPEVKGSGERVTGHHASVTTTVTLRDVTTVGQVVTRLVEQEQVTIDSLRWRVRPDNAVHREVRQAAVAELIVRATDYAEALGARVIGLVSLRDTSAGESSPIAMTVGYGGPSRSSAGYQAGLELDPATVRVTAVVEGTFRISAATALTDRGGPEGVNG